MSKGHITSSNGGITINGQFKTNTDSSICIQERCISKKRAGMLLGIDSIRISGTRHGDSGCGGSCRSLRPHNNNNGTVVADHGNYGWYLQER